MNIEVFCDRLLLAFVNGLYQGLALVAVVWLCLAIVPRLNAATRHLVWLLTLLIVAALPIIQFFLPSRVAEKRPAAALDLDGTFDDTLKIHSDVAEETPQSTLDSGTRGSIFVVPTVPVRRAESARPPEEDGWGGNGTVPELDPGRWSVARTFTAQRESNTSRSRRGDEADSSRADGVRLLTPAAGNYETSGRRTGIELPASAEPGAESGLVYRGRDETAALVTGTRFGFLRGFEMPGFGSVAPVHWQLSLPDRVGLALVGLWLALALARLCGLAGQCWRLRMLKRAGANAPEDLQTLVLALREQTHLKRDVRLVLSSESSAPMVAGFIHPAVLLPVGMAERAGADRIEQLLRHELAHVARYDDWTNLVQQIVRALFFFHPGVWWISKRLTLDREIACDDHVLAATLLPQSYARFLTEFAGRKQGSDMAAAPAAWSNKHQLSERITMILDPKRNNSPRLARTRAGLITSAATLAAIFGLYAGPRLVLAADDAEPPKTAESAIASEGATAVVTATSSDSVVSTVSAESGPRVKAVLRPGPVPVAAVATQPPQAPQAPQPPHADIRVTAPVVVAAPAVAPRAWVATASAEGHPHPKPKPATPAKIRDGDRETLERRLERLEKLVESLVSGEKKTKGMSADSFKFELKGAEFDHKFAHNFNQKLGEEAKRLAELHANHGLDEEEVKRIHEKVMKDVERAHRDVERAARDQERAVRQKAEAAEKRAQAKSKEGKGPGGDALKMERQKLEAHRRALEKQVQALERQIEKLEEEQEKIEEREEQLEEQSEQEEKQKEKGSADDGRIRK